MLEDIFIVCIPITIMLLIFSLYTIKEKNAKVREEERHLLA